ncbi:MAG: 2-oxoacid:acceptor oxidoreductase family protein [Desulfobacterota bacterium]|nr:2-oxoacid:acceptor oxidoreductase family protein [Thermodesulfobacteriota bacterium]MDW8001751.1 2-oxoacid:acceptor oxidoreductase family protein [Deltaproteobacteria bacterium]
MKEIRFHGRGGQGAVTSAELAAQAAISVGLYAQAFPSFGPERRGAPVQAFLRVSDRPVRLRSKIYRPDFIVILDSSLVNTGNIAEGLKPGGMVVISTNLDEESLRKLFPGFRIAYVDALKIAREEMGVTITNTTMLGALIKASNLFPIDALDEPVKERFKNVAQKNINAYKRAYWETKIIEA